MLLHYFVFRFSAVSYTNTYLGVPGRWEGGIIMDLEENGCTGMEWTAVPQDKHKWHYLVNVLMNFQGP